MSTRRTPLSGYPSKRRQRSISNPHSRPVSSSSPLEPITQDASISEEMSRRMLKRSRNSLKRALSGPDVFKSASVGASPADRPQDDLRPAKRSKAGNRAPLQTIVEPSHANTDEEGTVDMDLTDVVQLRTPVPREAPTKKQDEATTNEESDFLSPLPTSRLAKRVLAHRTSSSNLAENKEQKKTATSDDYMLWSPSPNDLASPFHSRPGSPSAALSAIDAKKALAKKLNRTRSVGTDLRRRATMRSFSRAVSPASSASSPGARRHPSLPSSQVNQKENQDWLIPAQLNQAFGHKTPRRPSDAGIPFVRESSFFDSVPEACSTPVHARRMTTNIPPTPGRDVDATPRMPLGIRPSSIFSQNRGSTAFALDEPTPRARLALGGLGSALLDSEDSLFPDSIVPPIESPPRIAQSLPATQTERRRMTVHMSRDSIFSSAMDFSLSVAERQPTIGVPRISDKTKVEPDSLTLAPPSSPSGNQMSPPSSDGDELRDMFSILGLDEDERWMTNSADPIDALTFTRSSISTDKTRKTRSSLSSRKTGNSKQHEVISVKARAARQGGRSSASSASQDPMRNKRVLITAESPRPRTLAKTSMMTNKQLKALEALGTVKMRILDKPIQPASDSSDELNLIKQRVSLDQLSSDF
ncbi:uncharacterized protein FOMMEDRAFT_150143 [Fomitiporia mediterranea MF3/22]|uniref:uncharacterized protein n=1 Tax=Fomitiporia mediterranea (strain MF3/22) TaxID=694068 RepID=UPI0004407764|nr:uncharacterized protein FOMMEDRAFT_150143 [Fomitiporia mediterranea MF3/22]EJD07605.1 hypothetical protein FOMMEDRAFT_150143 [Fomitiporia mediterranea MF3/22]